MTVITDIPARFKMMHDGSVAVAVDSTEDLTGSLIQVEIRSGRCAGQVRTVRLARQIWPYDHARGYAAVYAKEDVPRRERERTGNVPESAGERVSAPPIAGGSPEVDPPPESLSDLVADWGDAPAPKVEASRRPWTIRTRQAPIIPPPVAEARPVGHGGHPIEFAPDVPPAIKQTLTEALVYYMAHSEECSPEAFTQALRWIETGER